MHRGKIECLDTDIFQLFLIIGEASSGAAQRESRPEHDRIADLFCRKLCFLDAVSDLAWDHRLTYRLAHLFKEFSVFSSLDGVCRSSEEFDPALGKNALAVELHREVEPCLAADPRDDSVRPLISENLCNIFKRKRLHIDFVRNGRVSHDRCRVGIAEYHLIPFLFQRETGLSARIVKLRCLADDDRPASDNKYLFDIFSFCHILFLFSVLRKPGRADVISLFILKCNSFFGNTSTIPFNEKGL